MVGLTREEIKEAKKLFYEDFDELMKQESNLCLCEFKDYNNTKVLARIRTLRELMIPLFLEVCNQADIRNTLDPGVQIEEIKDKLNILMENLAYNNPSVLSYKALVDKIEDGHNPLEFLKRYIGKSL